MEHRNSFTLINQINSLRRISQTKKKKKKKKRGKNRKHFSFHLTNQFFDCLVGKIVNLIRTRDHKLKWLRISRRFRNEILLWKYCLLKVSRFVTRLKYWNFSTFWNYDAEVENWRAVASVSEMHPWKKKKGLKIYGSHDLKLFDARTM